MTVIHQMTPKVHKSSTNSTNNTNKVLLPLELWRSAALNSGTEENLKASLRQKKNKTLNDSAFWNSCHIPLCSNSSPTARLMQNRTQIPGLCVLLLYVQRCVCHCCKPAGLLALLSRKCFQSVIHKGFPFQGHNRKRQRPCESRQETEEGKRTAKQWGVNLNVTPYVTFAQICLNFFFSFKIHGHSPERFCVCV